jgi:hypothetical protein
MTVDISGTRSSNRWAGRRPGNWDRLHTSMLMPSDNDLGIPSLLPAGIDVIPDALTSWTARVEMNSDDAALVDDLEVTEPRRREHNGHMPPPAGLGHPPRPHTSRVSWHFFLDDYRFETTWNRPDGATRRVGLLGNTLTPDFSLWPEMPLVMQQWQVYRSRWLGALWQRAGNVVIPTISWAARKTYSFAFLGVPAGSVVAVSTVGLVRKRQHHPAFLAGYDAMMEAIEPAAVLCYGRVIPGMTGDVREYPTRWRA